MSAMVRMKFYHGARSSIQWQCFKWPCFKIPCAYLQEEGTLMGTAFGVCFGYWFGASSLMWFLSYVCNTHITILQLLSLVVSFLSFVCHFAELFFLWKILDLLRLFAGLRVVWALHSDWLDNYLSHNSWPHVFLHYMGRIWRAVFVKNGLSCLLFCAESAQNERVVLLLDRGVRQYNLSFCLGGGTADFPKLFQIGILTSRTAGKTQKIIVCAVVTVLHLCFLLYLHFAYHQIVEGKTQVWAAQDMFSVLFLSFAPCSTFLQNFRTQFGANLWRKNLAPLYQ